MKVQTVGNYRFDICNGLEHHGLTLGMESFLLLFLQRRLPDKDLRE